MAAGRPWGWGEEGAALHLTAHNTRRQQTRLVLGLISRTPPCHTSPGRGCLRAPAPGSAPRRVSRHTLCQTGYTALPAHTHALPAVARLQPPRRRCRARGSPLPSPRICLPQPVPNWTGRGGRAGTSGERARLGGMRVGDGHLRPLHCEGLTGEALWVWVGNGALRQPEGWRISHTACSSCILLFPLV